MIGFNFAGNTEVITALIAADPVDTHVLGSNFVDLLPLIVLVVVIDFSFDHLDGVSALTPDYIFIVLNQSCDHFLL